MKKILLMILAGGFWFVSFAQPVTVPDKTFGENGTKTTVKSTNPNNMEQETTIEYRETPNGHVRLRLTWKKTIDGKYTRIEESFTSGGTPTCKTTDSFDENKKWVRREEIIFKKDGRENPPTVTIVRDKDGKFNSTSKVKTKEGDLEDEDEELKKEIKKIETDNTFSLVPSRSACSQIPGSICQSKSRLFIGYSYLSGVGDQAESFPLGAHASFIYNATSHIGLGLDASIHTKTIDDEKLTRGFLLAEGKYTFGNTQNCDRMVVPDLHILAGLGCEKYGSSKGSGFAFGAGGGLDIKLSKKIALSTQVDFIGVKFKGADDLNSNLRASAGLSIRL